MIYHRLFEPLFITKQHRNKFEEKAYLSYLKSILKTEILNLKYSLIKIMNCNRYAF